ncbi:MAG: diphthine synthase [Candidatus Bilamarchaeaceae archaeon]
MLVLVGAGVNGDLTIAGLEELKKCDTIYAEFYTNPLLKEKKANMERAIGKRITELEREKVESSFLIIEAIEKRVALIVAGDPLIATTHVVLVNECRKRNIPITVIHNSSIYTVAPAKAGLQIYRFGKTVTLVNPRERYKPTSPLEVIRENLKRGLHTLVLLDTEPEPMDAKIALRQLFEFKSAIVLSRVGEADERIIYGDINSLLNEDLGKPPFSIIIPAKLHIVEKEALEWYSPAPRKACVA